MQCTHDVVVVDVKIEFTPWSLKPDLIEVRVMNAGTSKGIVHADELRRRKGYS
jgi:hypothetical protein